MAWNSKQVGRDHVGDSLVTLTKALSTKFNSDDHSSSEKSQDIYKSELLHLNTQTDESLKPTIELRR